MGGGEIEKGQVSNFQIFEFEIYCIISAVGEFVLLPFYDRLN